ncbi:hypothetical protein FOMPIDRAFT_1052389 [Fomitopsis schrenkii]|uniref:Uncharacterized protein n=1 Tax=Fomitopsis schrenkii TaxID=2126942 RepID=S8DXR3_FOMSC|nr:hypothetical protein FOMPIDRAFT_1052389 [Fomitopsis schrenkii]
MSVSELQPSPSPQSSSGKATLYARLVGRNFRWDNAHVWLPLYPTSPSAR